MFEYDKFGDNEAGILVSLILLYILVMFSVAGLVFHAIETEKIRYAVIAIIIAWAAKRNRIFEFSVTIDE